MYFDHVFTLPQLSTSSPSLYPPNSMCFLSSFSCITQNSTLDTLYMVSKEKLVTTTKDLNLEVCQWWSPERVGVLERSFLSNRGRNKALTPTDSSVPVCCYNRKTKACL